MRGSPRHSDMQLVRLVTFALTGFLVGGALGYMFIGTAHAVRMLSQDAPQALGQGSTAIASCICNPSNIPCRCSPPAPDSDTVAQLTQTESHPHNSTF